MANMMTNDGSTVPRAVTRLPRMPRSLYPIKIEMFTARMPGADWAMASRSIKSSLEIQFRLVTISFSIRGSIAASDSEGTNFEKDAECFKINIHLTYCSYSLFLFLLFLYILFAALFTIFAGAHFEMFLKHFPEVFDIVESRQFGYFGDRVLTGL